MYAVPPVENFSAVHLVYATGLTGIPDTPANLILDGTASSYNWDTKAVTGANYEPATPRSFPQYLWGVIIFVAFIIAYLLIRVIRKWIPAPETGEYYEVDTGLSEHEICEMYYTNLPIYGTGERGLSITEFADLVDHGLDRERVRKILESWRVAGRARRRISGSRWVWWRTEI